MEELESSGYFLDPVREQVEQVFLPFLLEEVTGRLSVMMQSRDAADSAIGSALEHIMSQIKQAQDRRAAEAERRARLAAEVSAWS